MSPKSPRVSVILPVYNGAEHLRAAVASVLAQSEPDLELIAVDDASSDESLCILEAVQDARLRVISLRENVGLSSALNIGIEHAAGSLIARQDQDDMSDPERLGRQLAVLRRDPETVLVGSWARILGTDAQGLPKCTGFHRHPVDDEILRFRLLWNNPFVHSSVVFRRDAFEAAGRYGTDPILNFPEDFDLWTRLSRFGRMANIPDCLVNYRQVSTGMSVVQAESIRRGVLRIATGNVALVTGRDTSDPTVNGLVRNLNSFPAPGASVAETAKRLSVLSRAANAISARPSLALRAETLKWGAKVMLRQAIPA